jgi:hypothetical protein
MATTFHLFSVELVAKIYRYLDPASHLDFALTDKHIFLYSYDILERHRKHRQSYRTLTDGSPETLIRALRNVATDHIAAWHIRTFEGLNASEVPPNYDATEAELVVLTKTVHDAMVANGIPAFSLRRLRNGDFNALQTALLALSMGLHTVKSTKFFPVPEDIDEEESLHDLWYEAEMP